MEGNEDVQNDSVETQESLEVPVETKATPLSVYSGLALAIFSLIISLNGIVALVAGILSFVQLSKSEPSSKNAKLALAGFLISLASLGYVMIRNMFF